MAATDPGRQEFEAALAASGFQLPPERRDVMFRCWLEVRRWRATIHAWDLHPHDEPGNAYRVETVPRSG